MESILNDADEFDALLVRELQRITAPLVSLSDSEVLLHIVQEISTVLTTIYGERANVRALTRRLQRLRHRFNKFKQFIRQPGVSFNETTNTVSLSTRFLPRLRLRLMVSQWLYRILTCFRNFSKNICNNYRIHDHLWQDRSDDIHFRLCGFPFYATCNEVFDVKCASSLEHLQREFDYFTLLPNRNRHYADNHMWIKMNASEHNNKQTHQGIGSHQTYWYCKINMLHNYVRLVDSITTEITQYEQTR